MEDQPTLQPSILPPQETPEIHGPVAEASAQPMAQKQSIKDILQKFTPFIVVFVIILIILVVSSLVTQKASTEKIEGTITPTPTSIVQNTSSKTMSYFATESAFMQFDSTIETLPKIIQGAVLQDPTALPPVLDLPLGFSN